VAILVQNRFQRRGAVTRRQKNRGPERCHAIPAIMRQWRARSPLMRRAPSVGLERLCV
jgi:hypothetical protein